MSVWHVCLSLPVGKNMTLRTALQQAWKNAKKNSYIEKENKNSCSPNHRQSILNESIHCSINAGPKGQTEGYLPKHPFGKGL